MRRRVAKKIIRAVWREDSPRHGHRTWGTAWRKLENDGRFWEQEHARMPRQLREAVTGVRKLIDQSNQELST